MQHLLSVDNLTAAQIYTLIDKAKALKKNNLLENSLNKPAYAANLFYENSTRTSLSFSLAAQRLGITMMPLSLQHSSIKKGETLLDTLKTLHAMGISLFVVRHPETGVFNPLLASLPNTMHVINAGDGQGEHPSQALLDIMTIVEHKENLQTLRIAIVGNICHSRVARSFQKMCALLGIKHLTFIAPPIWSPKDVSFGSVTQNLARGLEDADVVMTLRVQQERLAPEEQLCLQTYHAEYSLTEKTLAYAKPTAIVLHPGPMNRGIEISDAVADGAQSCILQQVENGVWMRMAIFSMMMNL